ncbi:MAG: YceI family protein [Paludibacter sp.]|nr:YceI family protein [Paludibacter sp.]
MRKISLSIAVMLFAISAFSQTWTSDPAHSRLGFNITHLMISHVTGNFKQFEITATTSKPDYSDAKVELTAQIASINTDQEQRDTHLKSDAFFDAQKFPTLSFKSTSIKHIKDKEYKLFGNLTMHGITKPVELNVVFEGKITNPMNKKEIAVFTITGLLKRSDFGIGTKFPAAMVGDDVNIEASAELSPSN